MKDEMLAGWSRGLAWLVPAAMLALAGCSSSSSSGTTPKGTPTSTAPGAATSGSRDAGTSTMTASGDSGSSNESGGSGIIASASDGGAESGASIADGGGVGSPTDAGATSAPTADASSTGPAAPPMAAAAGYTKSTLSSTFAQSAVDLGNTQKPGYRWYLGQYFGSAATDPSNLTFNADGSLTIDDGANINSTSPAGSGWVGEAFGGGGYFEATFLFDPANVINGDQSKGWPAWWGMAIEHFAGLPAEQWPGQPSGYSHFIETDFFEYDVWSFAPHSQYGGTMHDWYGVYAQTCGGGNYCNVSNAGGGGTSFSNFVVQTPSSTDYTQYHAFGFLWVPASSGAQGYAQFFFDGVASNDRVTWTELGNEAPPPGAAPWTFAILDSQHLNLILGTGQDQPMTLKSVNVWQASDADNLVQ